MHVTDLLLIQFLLLLDAFNGRHYVTWLRYFKRNNKVLRGAAVLKLRLENAGQEGDSAWESAMMKSGKQDGSSARDVVQCLQLPSRGRLSFITSWFIRPPLPNSCLLNVELFLKYLWRQSRAMEWILLLVLLSTHLSPHYL